MSGCSDLCRRYAQQLVCQFQTSAHWQLRNDPIRFTPLKHRLLEQWNMQELVGILIAAKCKIRAWGAATLKQGLEKGTVQKVLLCLVGLKLLFKNTDSFNFQYNAVFLTEMFPQQISDSSQRSIRTLQESITLLLQHTLSMFPTSHCGKWDLLRESLALCSLQNHFSKIHFSVNVSRSFQNFLWSLSKNGIYEARTIWWVVLIASCRPGLSPKGWHEQCGDEPQTSG